jgi:PAS domain-containing protein
LNDVVLILAIVLPTVLLAIWWALQSGDTPAPVVDAGAEVPVIVFRNDVLDYASDEALKQFPIAMGAHCWQDIHEILHPRYPDFPDRPPTDENKPVTVPCGAGGQGMIRICTRGDTVSLTFQDHADPEMSPGEIEELALLRQIHAHLPHPVWVTDTSGTVIWQNDAYTSALTRFSQNGPCQCDTAFDLAPPTADQKSVRVKLENPATGCVEWFDITRSSIRPGGVVHFATSLDALIRAENAQRDFVQTLAKTFAHLSIGLAIFNRDRQLALFNPALTDLTGLSASFLSPRPTIGSFFDALRENRRMPEPKNYRTWRQRLADLVSAAEHGKFEETWTLESGQTYRVKGRPHPDGAIAFLIEDISAEVSLTRNFRAELELGQNLVDTFEDALAVFSQSGLLTFSNKAYDLLWGFQGETSFADVTVVDAIQLCKEKSAPNPMWPELQDAVMSLGEREAWSMPVCLKGQSPMQCRIVPIASGATVVRFSRQTTALQAKALRQKKNSG